MVDVRNLTEEYDCMVFFKVSKGKSNRQLFCLENQPLSYTELEKVYTKETVQTSICSKFLYKIESTIQ